MEEADERADLSSPVAPIEAAAPSPLLPCCCLLAAVPAPGASGGFPIFGGPCPHAGLATPPAPFGWTVRLDASVAVCAGDTRPPSEEPPETETASADGGPAADSPREDELRLLLLLPPLRSRLSP